MDRRQLTRNIASGDRARSRMRATGLTPNGHPLWIDPETGSLRKGYPDYNKVLREVRRRTRAAAHSKASRLRITKPRARPWDVENDKPKMRRLYPSGSKSELLAAFPGRSWPAICSIARKWRIYRRRPVMKRDDPVVQSIVRRAAQQNISVKELTEMAGGGSLFRQGTVAKMNRRHWQRVARAVEALGGTLRARWV